MKEVVAIIRPEKWDLTRKAAFALGVEEISQRRVLGRGRQKGLRYLRPGAEQGGMQFLPKRMVTWLAPDGLVSELISEIIRLNKTGNYGDGKIFACPVEVAYGAGEKEAAEMEAAIA